MVDDETFAVLWAAFCVELPVLVAAPFIFGMGSLGFHAIVLAVMITAVGLNEAYERCGRDPWGDRYRRHGDHIRITFR